VALPKLTFCINKNIEKFLKDMESKDIDLFEFKNLANNIGINGEKVFI